MDDHNARNARAIVDEVADELGLNSTWDPISRVISLDSVAWIAIADDHLTLTLFTDYVAAPSRSVLIADLHNILRDHAKPQ
jgi:hypothetical protein